MKFVFWFAAASVVVGIADVASAADMAAKARSVSTYDPCGVARFNGAYLGGNAGAVAYTALRLDQDHFLADPAEYSSSRIGVTGGIQAGYDRQSCNNVLGIVADWNWADTAANTRLIPNLASGIDTSARSRMNWFSSVRARAGLAVNDTLLYVTGGVAAAQIESTFTNAQAGVFDGSLKVDRVRWGLAAGAGAEFALRDNWSLNAEVLYLQFQQGTDTRPARSPVRNVAFTSNDSAWVTRVGVNYRWDQPVAPVATSKVRGVAPTGPCGPARFNGGYVGGNAGALSYTALRGDRDGGFSADNGDYSATATGFAMGAQIGWDWQGCNALLGAVADWSWTGLDAKARIQPNGAGATFDRSAAGRMDWFSTIRARSGLVVDDVLVYVTGGLAGAKLRSTVVDVNLGNNDRVSFSDIRIGLTGGVGAEFALTGGWGVNTELLYMQFRRSENTFIDSFGRKPAQVDNHDSAWVSRVGLNYRWDTLSRAATGPTPRSPVRSCGASRFDGGYIGGNVGAIRRTSLTHDQDQYLSDNAEYTGTAGGMTAGAQAGFDWQSCSKVFGVVADWNWADAATHVGVYPNNRAVVDRSIRSNMKWFSSLRTRAGAAVDDTLVYLTGGVALANVKSTVTNIGTFIVDTHEQFSFENTRVGWVGGVGAERAIANGWSVNGEVLYVQFRKNNQLLRSPDSGNVVFNFENYDSAWIGRVGMNYRWGANAN